MRYHPGLGIGHVGVPNPSSNSPSQHAPGMEVDLSESVSPLEPRSMSPEESELQRPDEEEQASEPDDQDSEPDDQDSDHDAYSDHDNDPSFDLEGDSDSLDSIGSSSIDLDEGYDD